MPQQTVPSRDTIKQKVSAREPYFDLGTYCRSVSTRSSESAAWFNRGLNWCYGFNHEEAIYCFEQAILHDEECALAHWGVAYALGPNYNKPWEFFDDDELALVERMHNAVLKAQYYAKKNATDIELALCEAILARYPYDRPTGDLTKWNMNYADAMRKVHDRFPDDLDVAALYADALMNLRPWKLWDPKTKKPTPDAPTGEVQRVLEMHLKLEGGLRHPGLLHEHIHFWEMSPRPERALPVADLLRNLVPDAGHLQHMPSHLDVLCGDYRRAIAANLDATRADEKFAKLRGGLNFYTLYRLHDAHFGVYAAMLGGRSKVALEISGKIEGMLPEELLRIPSPPMADWLESFLTMRVHVLVRFGKWHEILALKLHDDQELYCTTTAMTLYAKGVAAAALGRVEEADKYREQFRDAAAQVPESRTLFNNKCTHILTIAAAMLDGEIDYRKGNFDAAFTHLRDAIRRDDALPYDEPWGWMQPARHAYGALLLEQGKAQEACDVYMADLGMNDTLPRQLQHLNNVWALHGLRECLLKLGRTAEAKVLQPQVNLALAFADIEVTSSCFCRLETGSDAGSDTSAKL